MASSDYYSATYNGDTLERVEKILTSMYRPERTEDTIFEVREGTRTIGGEALSNLDVTKVILPDSLETIDFGAFEGCTEMTEINLPEGLREISGGAFYGCESMQIFKLPSTIERIGEEAFRNCNSLEAIDMTGVKNLQSIGREAFSGCSRLKSILYPYEKGLNAVIGELTDKEPAVVLDVSDLQEPLGKEPVVLTAGDIAPAIDSLKEGECVVMNIPGMILDLGDEELSKIPAETADRINPDTTVVLNAYAVKTSKDISVVQANSIKALGNAEITLSNPELSSFIEREENSSFVTPSGEFIGTTAGRFAEEDRDRMEEMESAIDNRTVISWER